MTAGSPFSNSRGMYSFRFFKLMTGLLLPSFSFTRNRLLTNWLFAETFFIWTFSIAMLFKRFPISFTTTNLPFRLRWISLGNCCCKGWERKGICYSFTISKILRSFVRNYHFSTKYFSLPAIWTFGSWPDTSNIFTSLWAYGNFSRGIRVGISFKSPLKRLFSFTYLPLCLLFQLKFQLFCLLLFL